MKYSLFLVAPCLICSMSSRASSSDKPLISALSDAEAAYAVNSSMPYQSKWKDSNNNIHLMVSDQPITEEIMQVVTRETLSGALVNSDKVITVNGENPPLAVKAPTNDIIYTVRSDLKDCLTKKQVMADDGHTYYPLSRLTGDLCPKGANVDLSYTIIPPAKAASTDVAQQNGKYMEVYLITGAVYLADAFNDRQELVRSNRAPMTLEWLAPLLGSFKSDITLSGTDIDSDKVHITKYSPHNADTPAFGPPPFYNLSLIANHNHFVYALDTKPDDNLWMWTWHHRWAWESDSSPSYLNTTYLQRQPIAYSGFTPNTMVGYSLDPGSAKQATLSIKTEVTPMALFGYWQPKADDLKYFSYFVGEKEPTGGKGNDMFPHEFDTEITIPLEINAWR